MMVMEMGEDKPMFSMESEEKPSHSVNDTVTVKAVVQKISEIAKGDGKVCYVCDYQVDSVGGKSTEEEEYVESEGEEPEDDMEEINKVVEEEMSKDKKGKK